MVDLNHIAVFVKVAQLESFSHASRALGMPISTVSRSVSELEKSLGVTMLQRTTRKLTLTSQGRDYLNQCSEPLSLLFDAEHVLGQTQRRPEGILRVSVPIILSPESFLAFIGEFIASHPRVKIDLIITNKFVDLIGENIDLAIRFGALKDSSLIVQKLGTSVRYLVATKQYLRGRKAPETPEDLKRHDCIMLHAKQNETEWEIVNGRKRAEICVTGPVSSSDFQSVSSFVYRGHGIGLLPTAYCEDEIRRGELVRVLPDWSSKSIDVHALYPTRNFLPSRLSLFLETLKNWDSPLWTRLPH